MNDPKQLDREIEQAQADIGMLERIKGAPTRLREALARKKVEAEAAETAEQKRQRIEAESLVRVHATGALVDDAIDALVVAVKNANAAQADFWAVSPRTESRTSPLDHVLSGALRGFPEACARRATPTTYHRNPVSVRHIRPWYMRSRRTCRRRRCGPSPLSKPERR